VGGGGENRKRPEGIEKEMAPIRAVFDPYFSTNRKAEDFSASVFFYVECAHANFGDATIPLAIPRKRNVARSAPHCSISDTLNGHGANVK
jgi:hypothetical protein